MNIQQRWALRRQARPIRPVFFAEEHADGFVDDEPRWLAYCPDQCARLPQALHEECPYFGGTARDEQGNLLALRCRLLGRR
ncbi:MAG: hypothetical protein U0167_17905 [bacterium]